VGASAVEFLDHRDGLLVEGLDLRRGLPEPSVGTGPTWS
jgi:hypothetical protein